VFIIVVTPRQKEYSAVVYSFNNIIYGNINKLSESESEPEEYPLQLHCGEPIMRMDYNLIYNANNLKNSSGSGQSYFNYDYTLDVDLVSKIQQTEIFLYQMHH